jgi:hypothetical protein
MSNARNMARLKADSVGNISTVSMPAVSGSIVSGTVNSAYMPSGSVLQVVSSLNQTYNTSTVDLGYWTTVPSMSVVINPKRSNSKFLINVRWGGEVAGAWDVVFAISRNGTIIGLPSQEGSRMGSISMPLQSYIDDNNDSTPEYTNFVYLDSPGIVSTITYALVSKAWSSRTLYTGSMVNGADNPAYERLSTEIIVTEIAV